MKIRFWPSLQLLAQVRIARGILCNLEFENVFPNFVHGVGFIDLEYMHQILSSFHLTNVLKNRTMGIIEALGKEIESWCSCHRSFLIDSNHDYWNRIQWYSHGTINRLETARALIRDEDINIVKRFNLACEYYLEADVRTLWENMSSGHRQFFITKNKNRNRKFWLNALQTNTPLDWLAISLAIMSNDFSIHDPSSYFYWSFLGLLHFFPKLNYAPARLSSILCSVGRRELHPFDFYLCLRQMNEHELDSLFHYLSREKRLKMCEWFLQWPLQILFLDLFQHLRRNMSKKFYNMLFKFIFFEKYKSKWLDYDYLNLVKQIWSSVSDDIKTRIKNGGMYVFLKVLLDIDGQ
ncbi:uncharacterized protein NPIL_358691 [Nephila pilipes]|uniref:Uncharacterized protein n=1 Tax=Nephila pilipes TaxID=299642 RepID=A0A8X6P3V3_NEPPI|nr:uncharacterized protein NPIL_358691 [Nephila pilipes]